LSRGFQHTKIRIIWILYGFVMKFKRFFLSVAFDSPDVVHCHILNMFLSTTFTPLMAYSRLKVFQKEGIITLSKVCICDLVLKILDSSRF